MEFDHGHTYGVVRREFLQVGFSAFLGLGAAALLAGRARAGGLPARRRDDPRGRNHKPDR